jgi:hypothetical protein
MSFRQNNGVVIGQSLMTMCIRCPLIFYTSKPSDDDELKARHASHARCPALRRYTAYS